MLLPRTLAPLLALSLAALAVAQNPPTGFTYQTLVSGPLNGATAMAFLPDGRLFLTERTTGQIRVFANGVLQAAPWATVPVFGGGSYAEQGLIGIAVDPGFLTNHYVYVFYTDASGIENRIGRLQEVNGVGTNLTVLSPNGALDSRTLHNGGPLLFGNDGKLFVATGDFQDFTRPQDLNSWNGKILRFDVPNLTVPANNPFPGNAVYSYGHRNQFGLAIHPVTGDLFQTENGGALMDEINRIVPGGNYGWPTVEGRELTPNASYVDPLSWYQPTTAPTGTCFYSGENYPAQYQNVWFWTDWNQNRVHAVTLNATGQSVLSQVQFDNPPGAGYGIVMGPDGNLWFLTNDNGGYGGNEIGRYVHQNEPMPSAHMMAVSNRSLGGAVTIGVHAQTGNLVLPWVSTQRYSTPVPTQFGNQWVPVDAVMSLLFVTGDERCYQGFTVPNDLSFVGTTLHMQALVLDPTTGQFSATNPARHVLRG
ncbi:MAG: PQQ-dependent sugar dehydrogenase [Planctomycetes bacterium]|nr:PQQ-dependent sugar dehydrogenase [Planctomycetota bacterium]